MKNPFSEETPQENSDLSQETKQNQATQEPTEQERLTSEKSELIMQLQRLQAEFDNYRKRIERDAVDNKLAANNALLHEIVPILDNLDLALQHAKDEHGVIKAEDLLSGVVLIKDQIKGILDHQGIEEMECTGRFDPKLHEALLTVEQEGAQRGNILQVFQKGYTRYGKPFRAAKVSVAK